MSETLYDRLSTKRKKLQSEGLVPEWYTTAALQMFEEKYEYQTNGRSVKGQFERIAKTAAKHIEKEFPEAESKFFNLLWSGWLSPSTPVLANMGTDRGMPVSCSGGVVGDSIDSFYKSQHELAMLTKYGFGTSSDLSGIRSRGSKISVGGKASGVLPVYKMYVETMRNVAQGTSRRGAWAGYLDIEHGDFDELWNAVNDDPDDSNIGWIIRNSFIEKLNSGDTEAVRRYQKALKLKMVQGKGYFCFVDKINAKRPAAYVNNNLTVKSSNLCNEITLYSDEDYTFSCILSSMNVYKYEEWKDTDAVFWATLFLDCVAEEFIQKGKDIPGLEKAIRSTIKGRALGLGQCGWHSLLQKKRYTFGGFDAQMLSMEIAQHIYNKSKEASTLLASTFGEPEWCKGTQLRNSHRCVSGDTRILTKNGQVKIKDTIGKKIDIWNGFEWSEVEPFKTGVSELYRVTFSNGMHLDCTNDHKFVVLSPIRNTKSDFGYRTLDIETRELRIGDCLPKFISPISVGEKKLEYAYESGLFTGDGSINCSKEGKYPRKELRLYGEKQKLSSEIIWKSSKTWGENCVRGYLPDAVLDKFVVPFEYDLISRQKWLAGLVDSDGSSGTKGVSISTAKLEFAQDVFLLVQSLGGEGSILKVRRKGGYSSENKEHYVVTITQFSLEKVFSMFKPKRVKINFTKSTSKTGKLQLVHVVSVERLDSQNETFCFTEKNRGTGVFNGLITKQCAIAPTKSTALLMGGISEGINPDPGMVYTQNTAAGVVDRIVPEFLLLLKEKGHYSRKTLDSIISKQGSVQHLEWLTDEEKAVFKTAFEINQKNIIRQAATRGKYLDQWQSLNLFFPADEDEAWISEVHQEAFENKDILGLYYIYTQAGVTGAKGECEACQ